MAVETAPFWHGCGVGSRITSRARRSPSERIGERHICLTSRDSPSERPGERGGSNRRSDSVRLAQRARRGLRAGAPAQGRVATTRRTFAARAIPLISFMPRSRCRCGHRRSCADPVLGPRNGGTRCRRNRGPGEAVGGRRSGRRHHSRRTHRSRTVAAWLSRGPDRRRGPPAAHRAGRSRTRHPEGMSRHWRIRAAPARR